jgi:hypothetical protein
LTRAQVGPGRAASEDAFPNEPDVVAMVHVQSLAQVPRGRGRTRDPCAYVTCVQLAQ